MNRKITIILNNYFFPYDLENLQKCARPPSSMLTKLKVVDPSNSNIKNMQTNNTPGNSTTIKRNDNTYTLNNRNNSACSMNSTKQLINNEILKKKYSMPGSKETTLSNLLNKNIAINKRVQGPLSQRLLKKKEDLKIIDDLYKLPKPIEFHEKNAVYIEKSGDNFTHDCRQSQEKSSFSQKQSTEKKNYKEDRMIFVENERICKFFSVFL